MVLPEEHSLDYSQILSFTTAMYKDAIKDEYVRIFSSCDKKNRYVKARHLTFLSGLKQSLAGFSGHDLYMSFNTFRYSEGISTPFYGTSTGGFGTMNKLFNVYHFVIDVDYKKGSDGDCSVEDAMRNLANLTKGLEDDTYLEDGIPKPDIVEYGNQFRLIYTLKYHLSTKKQFGAIKHLCERLVRNINAYKWFDFCAELQSLNSMVRVPSSLNCKNNWKNEYFHVSYDADSTYIPCQPQEELRSLGYFMERALGPLEEQTWYPAYRKNKDKKRQKTAAHRTRERQVSVKVSGTVNDRRIKDIEKVTAYRNDRGNIMGFRDHLLFVYGNQWYLKTNGNWETTIEKTLDLNNTFRYPLSLAEVRSVLSGVRSKKGYYISNDTLLDRYLEVTDLEVQKLQLHTRRRSYYTNQPDNTIRRRGEMAKGMTKHQQIEKTIKKVLNLRRRGKRNKEIAASLGISEKTLERYITTLIKSGKLTERKTIQRLKKVLEKAKEKPSFCQCLPLCDAHCEIQAVMGCFIPPCKTNRDDTDFLVPAVPTGQTG